ncbi:MAG: hypothetical protein JNK14_18315 [Chitinophagaceae bacterium]|nr:hypothetical protein [Chitinophagaceae bacterium]
MLRLFLAIGLIGFSLICSGQMKIKDYRAMADMAIKKYFSDSGFKEIQCITYLAQEIDTVGLTQGYYEEDKEKIINPSLISVLYFINSKELNYDFEFIVTIDSSLKVFIRSERIEGIPLCVREKKICHFISTNKAKSISIKDAIDHPDNLMVELVRPANSSEFFWVVSGQDKRNVNYNTDPVENWPLLPKQKNNTRYINAVTAKIVSYEDYSLLNR